MCNLKFYCIPSIINYMPQVLSAPKPKQPSLPAYLDCFKLAPGESAKGRSWLSFLRSQKRKTFCWVGCKTKHSTEFWQKTCIVFGHLIKDVSLLSIVQWCFTITPPMVKIGQIGELLQPHVISIAPFCKTIMSFSAELNDNNGVILWFCFLKNFTGTTIEAYSPLFKCKYSAFKYSRQYPSIYKCSS